MQTSFINSEEHGYVCSVCKKSFRDIYQEIVFTKIEGGNMFQGWLHNACDNCRRDKENYSIYEVEAFSK